MAGRDVDLLDESTASDASTTNRADVASEDDADAGLWSDGDGTAAYKAFKNRKSLKRKRAAALTRRVRARATASEKSAPRTSSTKKTQTTAKDKVWRAPDESETEKESKNGPQLGEFLEDQDEELPDYLKQRRDKFDQRRAQLAHAGLHLPPLYQDIEFSDDERLTELEERPRFPNLAPCAPYKDITLPYSLGIIPAPLAQRLREYQVQGAAFLHELFVYQKGGILGDDMGLGKTVQVIACLTAAFGKTCDARDSKRMRKMRRAPTRPFYPKVLIICPGTLIHNWQAELQTWGWWQVDVYHGSAAAKEAALQAASSGRLEIMITTYTTYRLNQAAINMIAWDCVIADECHTIKEPTSEVTRAMQVVNALCRIGLTGTAIQNNYEELWTLLNWSNPGRFGPLSAWRIQVSSPLKMGQSHNATVPQLAKARKTARQLVQNLLPEFFLRRMKTLIADQLPKKSDRVVFCPLTEIQAQAYENITCSDVIEAIRRSSEMCDCKSGIKRGWCCYKFIRNNKWQNLVFPYIASLKKLSNHTALLIPTGAMPLDKQERELDLLELALPDLWKRLYAQRDNIVTFANQDLCGKWKVLKKLLRFWHSQGDKALVFSHSVRLLRMLQMLFTSTTTYTTSYLDGTMTYSERADVVAAFNSDPRAFVFLLSTRAGGVGLNITSANKVVVVDPHWNPAYDLQAQDRAYRIGQSRNVDVFRLVSAGTIEEIVYARQIYKQQQANIGYTASDERRYFTGVQDTNDMQGDIFGLRNMFAYQGDNVVLREIVNKTNVAESRAGVQVVGFDVKASPDDGGGGNDDEDRAMSQLVAQISDGIDPDSAGDSGSGVAEAKTTTNANAVSAILASAGVAYTHENSEVVGSSRVEKRLSRRAEAHIAAGGDNEAQLASERVFAEHGINSVPPTYKSSHKKNEEDKDDIMRHEIITNAQDNDNKDGKAGKEALNITNTASIARNDAGTKRYHPPPDIAARHFCSLALHCGYGEDVVGFALQVEAWTAEKRRDVLEEFYAARSR